MLTFQHLAAVANQPGRLHNQIGLLQRRRLLLTKFFLSVNNKSLRVQCVKYIFLKGPISLDMSYQHTY